MLANPSKKSMKVWIAALSLRAKRRLLSFGRCRLGILLSLALMLCPVGALAATTFNTTLTMPNNSLGMVGHWTFDGKDMIRNVADTSGQGNTGNPVNFTSTTTVPGVLGQALSFNGLVQYVNIPSSSSLNFAGPITLAAWVYPNSFTTGTIIGKDAGGNVKAFSLELVSGDPNNIRLAFGGFNGNVGTNIAISPALTAKKWQYIVGIADGSNFNVYVNGVLAGQYATTTVASTATAVTALGANNIFGCCGLDGYMDDARVYNRALSAAEVKQLYTQGTGTHQNVTLTSPNLASGLVGHWTFDGKDLIRNVADTSGLGNTGVLLGFAATTTVPGVSGQALKFNGLSEKVTVPDSSSLNPNPITGNWSVAAWIRTSANTYQTILAKNDPENCGDTYHLSMTGAGNAAFTIDNGTLCSGQSEVGTSTSATSINNDTWHYVVGTRTGVRTVNIYVDGRLENTNTFDGTLSGLQPTTALSIGNQGGSAYWNGSIDDVRIYNRALSAAEVLQLYNQAVGTHQNVTLTPPNLASGLVGHWTFDGKDLIRNVADTSGQGNNGSLVGATTTVAGVMGQALSFDGTTGQYINVGNVSTYNFTTQNFSLSVWVKSPPLGRSASDRIINRGSDGTNGYSLSFFSIGADRFDLAASTYQSGAAQAIITSTFVVPDKWYHIVFTRNGTVGSIYINGVEASYGTRDSLIDPATSASNLYFNRYENPTIEPQETMDDVRIYNRALSAAEVLQLYKLGR